MNPITIKHKEGIGLNIFLTEHIFLILLSLFLIVHLIREKHLFSPQPDWNSLILIFVLLFAMVRAFMILREIYAGKSYVIDGNILKVNDVEYRLSEINYEYLPTWPTTLLAVKLFEKESKKQIGLLFFTFWGGSLLNITPDSFEKVFTQKPVKAVNEYNKEIEKKSVSQDIDMEQESKDIKMFDGAWYLAYAFFLIPVTIILYLMVTNLR